MHKDKRKWKDNLLGLMSVEMPQHLLRLQWSNGKVFCSISSFQEVPICKYLIEHKSVIPFLLIKHVYINVPAVSPAVFH